jgi:RimJ/RimL family protein N-acetyltransferase
VGRCPSLDTERLHLRPFRESDLDSYHAIISAEGVRRALHIDQPLSREDVWQQMALMLGQWELRNHGQWAVEERATRRLVGRAGAHRPERADWPGIEIGWTLDPAAWGQGYATEAGRAAIAWVFANHDVDVLFSMILPENTASQAVARRIGFEPGEERVFAFFPSLPHNAWRLTRTRWANVGLRQADT